MGDTGTPSLKLFTKRRGASGEGGGDEKLVEVRFKNTNIFTGEIREFE